MSLDLHRDELSLRRRLQLGLQPVGHCKHVVRPHRLHALELPERLRVGLLTCRLAVEFQRNVGGQVSALLLGLIDLDAALLFGVGDLHAAVGVAVLVEAVVELVGSYALDLVDAGYEGRGLPEVGRGRGAVEGELLGVGGGAHFAGGVVAGALGGAGLGAALAGVAHLERPSFVRKGLLVGCATVAEIYVMALLGGELSYSSL